MSFESVGESHHSSRKLQLVHSDVDKSIGGKRYFIDCPLLKKQIWSLWKIYGVRGKRMTIGTLFETDQNQENLPFQVAWHGQESTTVSGTDYSMDVFNELNFAMPEQVTVDLDRLTNRLALRNNNSSGVHKQRRDLCGSVLMNMWM